MITVEDLQPGRIFRATHQGCAITPRSIDVRVYWVGPDRVYYHLAEIGQGYGPQVHDTHIDRFLDIINQPNRPGP